jgi:hypothetical protein
LVSVDSRTGQNIDFMGESCPTSSQVHAAVLIVTCWVYKNTL